MNKLYDDNAIIKQKLFEMMENIASLPHNNEEEELGDVKNLNNLISPAQKKAALRINTQREFNEAFEDWFNSLGFHDENKKNKINISTTVTFIEDVFKKNGIKY